MTKKIISVFLSIALILSMLPGACLTANAVSSDEAQAYLPVAEDMLESLVNWMSEDFASHYARGILYDMDHDGVEELILSYPLETDQGWPWYYAYSIYDFEQGKLVTVAEDITIGATSAAAGSNGFTGVALYNNEPVLITYAENGETSRGTDCKYPKRSSRIKVYSYDLRLIKTIEVQTTYEEIIYSLDGNTVSEQEFQKEMEAFTYLEFVLSRDIWIYFQNTIDSIPLDELVGYLENAAPEESGETGRRLAQMDSYWDDEKDSTYLYYDDLTGLLERVEFSYDYESPDLLYEYDEMNRLVKVHAGDIEEEFYSYVYLEFIYDDSGRLIKWKEFSPGLGNWEGNCVYDTQGRLVQTLGDWDAAGSEKIEFQYDESGRLLEAVTSFCAQDSVEYERDSVTEYQYDAQGRVSARTITTRYGTHVEKFIYSYEPFVIIQDEDEIEAYYDLGYLNNMNVHLACSFYGKVYGRFGFFGEADSLRAGHNGYLEQIKGSLNQGKNKIKSEFMWETFKVDAVVPSQTVELKVYTTFPYAALGVDQTAKLLVTLLVNGKMTPIQGFALANSNPEVIDLVETEDANGVRVLTFKTLSPGVANLTFTEGSTGAAVSIDIAVEEMCSYHRCSNFPIPDASSFPIHVADFQCTENPDGTHNVKFNAYNTSYAYGVAVVYDETDKFWGCVPINPRYDGTGMEYIVNGFWQAWEQSWYWIDGDKEFYEVASNAMRTEVEFTNIPQNAKIIVTADGRESMYPTLYTGIDIFMKVAFYSSNLDLKIDVFQKSVKNFAEALLKALPADAVQNTIQTLTTDISMAMIDGANTKSVEKVYQIVWNMISKIGLDADKMLKDVLLGLGYSVADTIVIAAIPVYTLVDVVNKITAVSWLFTDYEYNLDRGKMEIHCVGHESDNRLVNSSVVVMQQSSFGSNTVLDAYEVVKTDELAALSDSIPAEMTNYAVYSIKLREKGVEVQPNGEIEVQLPVPDGADGEKCIVYRLEEDGGRTLLQSSYNSGVLTFKTSHLNYCIIGQIADSAVEPAPNRQSQSMSLYVIGAVALLLIAMIIFSKKRTGRKYLVASLLVTAALGVSVMIFQPGYADDQTVVQNQEDNRENTDTPEETAEAAKQTEPDDIVGLSIRSTYSLGDTLDAARLNLVAIYESGKKEPVTSGFTCSPTSLNQAGTQSVTVSYGGVTQIFDVEVLDFFSYEVDWSNCEDADTGVGFNENGERVNYRLMIAARHRGNWVKSCSETDIKVNFSFADTNEGNWENAKNGKSSCWMFGTAAESVTSSHWEGMGFVFPDDPAFAGDYSVTLTFGDLVKRVNFTLVYNGDYETGTGWSITNVNWTK